MTNCEIKTGRLDGIRTVFNCVKTQCLTVASRIIKFCEAKPESKLSQEAITALYVAREFLPGFFQKKVFLIISLILPFVDFITDYSNAGTG